MMFFFFVSLGVIHQQTPVINHMYDSQSVIKVIVLFSVTIVTSMHTLIPVDAQDTLSDVDTRSLVNSDRR